METKKILIKNVCKLNMENINMNKLPDELLYLDTGNITKNIINNIHILDTRKDKIPSRARKKVKNNTIIYSTVRPNQMHYGILKNPERNLVVSTGFVTIDIVDEEIDPTFFYYKLTLNEITNYLQTVAENSVSAYPSITPDNIGEIELEIPKNRIVQEKISNCLWQLDKKIELNNKINSELEEMAQTLYNYWFVQFDFPDENGNPYKSSGGAMEWNDELKKEIPVGWEVKELGSICEIYQPQTISETQMIKNGKYFVFGANGVIGKYNKYNHENSEIVITCRGSTCGNITRTYPFSWITGNAMVVKLKNNKIHNEFLFCLLQKSNIHRIITGSAQPQITRTNLSPVTILQPSKELLQKFSIQIEANVNKRLKLIKENQELINLRDWLLPILMNGQVIIE